MSDDKLNLEFADSTCSILDNTVALYVEIHGNELDHEIKRSPGLDPTRSRFATNLGDVMFDAIPEILKLCPDKLPKSRKNANTIMSIHKDALASFRT